MAAVRTQAIVIRGVDVSESSKVVTLFTRDLGKTSAMAKGVRRLRSSFRAGLDLLSLCDIVLLHKASESLDLLTEAELAERFDSLRHDPAALYAGCHVAELLDALTVRHDPQPKLFDAARVTLRHLGDPRTRPGRILRFELACLRELGLMPALDHCVHCGQVVEAEGRSVAFALSTGGVLCADCRPGQPHVATLSGATLGAIRLLASPGPAWRALCDEPDALAPVRATLGAVISHLMGRRPRLLGRF